ncbi:GGDEF domain-containing protein [Rhizobium alvei]|uniref:diguanylate cyclase n=1 Tax=Rhizobium alvei TaxID=1132659 RepID=A0ABT8YII6_9HYPH|nr:GGDEF domain-containing protein [Rhizobium alvei]MDO6963512.1 GGDEF domain-containing protein [Rhizobium alvei]
MNILKSWIERKIETGRFQQRGDVLLFALSRGAITSFAAVGLNHFIYFVLAPAGIIKVPVPSSPVADAFVTLLVSGPISFLAFAMMGQAIHSLALSRDSFERLSRIDPLTGLLNRRAFVEKIEQTKTPYLLVLFDIDRFKSINDRFGHPVGDWVLVDVARLLEEHFSATGYVARLGGEEFGVVICDMPRAAALEQVDLFRAGLANRLFERDDLSFVVTISGGVAEANGTLAYSVLLNSADRALYIAKAAGRNRIVEADELSGPGLGEYLANLPTEQRSA